MKNKTVDKIEKLKLPKTPLSPFQLGYQDESGRKIMVWEIAEKLNDVIDYINQSPKQPEEYKPEKVEIKEIVDILQEALDYLVCERDGEKFWIRDFDINLWKYLPERYKRLSFNQSQKEQPEEDYKCGTLEVLKNPKLRERLEKQEKWKEELWKIMFNDRTQLAEANLNKPYTGEYQGKAEELISQLLSERTFSKEELEHIHFLVSREDFEVKDTELEGSFDNKKLLKKISKLLKEEE